MDKKASKIKQAQSPVSNAKSLLITLWQALTFKPAVSPPHSRFRPVIYHAESLQKAPLALIASILLIGLLLWSVLAKIDQFTSIPGRVIPQGNILKIEHLDGGIIEEILVTPGQIVTSGDALFRISLSGQSKSLSEITAELSGLHLRRQRLRAERDGIPLVFSPELTEIYPDLAHAEAQAFDSRRKRLGYERKILVSQLEQEQFKEQEIHARLKASRKELEALSKKFSLQKKLARDDLIPELDIIDLEVRIAENQGRVQSMLETLSFTQSRQEELQTRIDSLNDVYQDKVLSELLDVETSIEPIELTRNRFAQRDLRREIRAPESGIVKEVYKNTIGSVIRPGETLAEIVPEKEQLIIEGYLPTSERGKVSVGQETLVKVSAFDFLRFGGLDGKVVSISADAFIDEQKGSYYKTIIETSSLSLEDESASITSGMDVIAEIKSDRRRVITYLLYPFLRVKTNAFRE